MFLETMLEFISRARKAEFWLWLERMCDPVTLTRRTQFSSSLFIALDFRFILSEVSARNKCELSNKLALFIVIFQFTRPQSSSEIFLFHFYILIVSLRVGKTKQESNFCWFIIIWSRRSRKNRYKNNLCKNLPSIGNHQHELTRQLQA